MDEGESRRHSPRRPALNLAGAGLYLLEWRGEPMAGSVSPCSRSREIRLRRHRPMRRAFRRTGRSGPARLLSVRRRSRRTESASCSRRRGHWKCARVRCVSLADAMAVQEHHDLADGLYSAQAPVVMRLVRTRPTSLTSHSRSGQGPRLGRRGGTASPAVMSDRSRKPRRRKRRSQSGSSTISGCDA